MKKEFILPQINIKSFNKEVIIQDSEITNEQAAVNKLNSPEISVNRISIMRL